MRKKSSGSAVTELSSPASPARATAHATAEFAARFAPRFSDGFYRDTSTGLVVSSIGAGTYLGECDEADDERYGDTLARAIAAGVNLLDTAINYRCQRSERAVGAAIERAAAAGDVTREALVVCTKGGYVPLENHVPTTRDGYRDYLKRAFYDPGIMSPDDVVVGGHSIAPGFLKHVIALSRRNLGLRTIDVYYLHNPEQQAAAVSAQSLRQRLRAAFMVLEDAVSRGDIGVYGCATWNALRVLPAAKGFLSLQELVQLAREVAGDDHHFKVVQLPINLAMPEALRVPTQPIGKRGALAPAVEAAASLGLAVVASASLMQGQLTRDLPVSMRGLFPGLRTDAQRALAFARTLPDVTAALVGMRDPEHLAENLQVAARGTG